MFDGARDRGVLPGEGASSGARVPSGGPALVGLVDAVERLVRQGISADSVEIVLLRRQIDRLHAVVAEAETRFATAELWRDDGASSMRTWLSHHCGLSRRDASRASRRAARLASWPQVGAAWRSGRLTVAQVDAMVTIVPARFTERFAEQSDAIGRIVAPLDAGSTEIALRQWVRMAEADDGPGDLVDRASGVHVSTLMDGSLAIDGVLHGADAAILAAALRVFEVPEAVDEVGRPVGAPRTFAGRTADALVAMARCALDHREGPGEGGRFLPHVSLVLDVAEMRAAALRGAGIRAVRDLEHEAERRGWTAVERAWFADALTHHGDGTTTDGLVLDAAAISALSCDSVVHRVVTSRGEVLDVGREERTATKHQRRAIVARDRHCRAPGCRARPRHCEVHHVDHWILGGRTDIGRMVLLCGTHHRQFHRDGYRLELSADATFTVHSPKGWSRSSVPERVEASPFPLRSSRVTGRSPSEST